MITALSAQMSPEAVTAERIQLGLKDMLIQGDLGIGIPLVVQSLADQFGVSITPVRDALNRLVGERLIDAQAGGGFAVPGVTRERAEGLYRWHADIIGAVLRTNPDLEKIGPAPEQIDGPPMEARRVAALTVDFFDKLASGSSNPEHRFALERVAGQLHMLRLHEGRLARGGAELKTLWQVLHSRQIRALRDIVSRYHRKRIEHAGQIAIATMGSIRAPRKL